MSKNCVKLPFIVCFPWDSSSNFYYIQGKVLKAPCLLNTTGNLKKAKPIKQHFSYDFKCSSIKEQSKPHT